MTFSELIIIQDKIRKLVRKYLDIHKSAVERVDAMELIKKKVTQLISEGMSVANPCNSDFS